MKNFEAVNKNLTSLGYKVSVFETAKEAVSYLTSSVKNTTVGFGGSMTLAEIGLYGALSESNRVYSHANIPEGMTADQVRAGAGAADVYFSSVNGLAETGEIINIDGHCNRVASTLYGHKKVFFVVGKNKLAPDYESALFRARNVAAPKNARRLHKNTPCAVNADRCYNCKSPERICRALSVLWCKPTSAEYEIVLINEELGY